MEIGQHYRKDLRWPIELQPGIYRGYWKRVGRPTHIVIHSTNGNSGSSFAGECLYLRDSAEVSADFVVGKRPGQIEQILDSDRFAAWHAGRAIAGYDNQRSIGIECHHAVGEGWPAEQIENLTWLVRYLMARYTILVASIDTHRHVALPAGRKEDPSDWADAAFYAWRAALEGPQPRDLMVIGTGGQSVSLLQFGRACERRHVPLSASEIGRIYRLAAELDMDAGAILAMALHEGNGGASPLQTITLNALNIRAAEGDTRLMVYHDAQNNAWYRFENYFLGLLYGLVYLKNEYGGFRKLRGLCEILRVFAPVGDGGNNPDAYADAVLTDIDYMRAH